jgi:flagellar biosynthetic protein FliQ
MSPELVMAIGRDGLATMLLLAAPLLVVALGVGLTIGIFQAATQINEMTLSFIPKLLGIAVAIMLAGPWMLKLIVDYTQALILNIPNLIR